MDAPHASGSEPVLAHLILVDPSNRVKERFPIQSNLTRMGRSMDNDVRFLKNDVSRLHCTVEVSEEGAFLHVFGCNGVGLNDMQALPEPKGEGRYPLTTGDIITLSKRRFRFELAPATQRPASPVKPSGPSQTPAKRRLRMSLVNLAQIDTPSKASARRRSLGARPLSPVKKMKLLPPMAQMDEEPADVEMKEDELVFSPAPTEEDEEEDVVILEEVEEREASTTPTGSPERKERRKSEFLGRAGPLQGVSLDFYPEEREKEPIREEEKVGEPQAPLLVPLPRRPSRLSSPTKRRVSLRTQTLLRSSAQYYDRLYLPPSPNGMTKSSSMPSQLSRAALPVEEPQDDADDEDEVDESLSLLVEDEEEQEEPVTSQPPMFMTPQPKRRIAKGRTSLPVARRVIRCSDVGLPATEISMGTEVEAMFEDAEEDDTDEEEVEDIPATPLRELTPVVGEAPEPEPQPQEPDLPPQQEEEDKENLPPTPAPKKYGMLASRMRSDPLLSSLLKTPDMRHLRHVFAMQTVPDPPLGEVRNLFRSEPKAKEVLDGDTIRELMKTPAKAQAGFTVLGEGAQDISQEMQKVLSRPHTPVGEVIQDSQAVEETEVVDEQVAEAQTLDQPVAEEAPIEEIPMTEEPIAIAPLEEPEIATAESRAAVEAPTSETHVDQPAPEPVVEEEPQSNDESPSKRDTRGRRAADPQPSETPQRKAKAAASSAANTRATRRKATKTDDEEAAEAEPEVVIELSSSPVKRSRKAQPVKEEQAESSSSPVKARGKKAAIEPPSSPVKARSKKAAPSEPETAEETVEAPSSPVKKTRGRKAAAAKSEAEDESDAPKKTRGRKPAVKKAAAEEEPAKPTRSRKAAAKTDESSPVKATRGRKAKASEAEEEAPSSPVKPTRSRKAAPKATRSRRAATVEPESATANTSPVKPTRTRKIEATSQSSPPRRTTRSRAKQ